MALNSSTIKGSNAPRTPQADIEPGVYPSRIVQIIDLGLQTQRPYQGKEKNPANEILLTYELVDCFMVDKDGVEQLDKPRWVSETLPLYNIEFADKAKCTQRYKAADPNNVFGGDFSRIADIPVNISLVQNKQGEKVYTNVAALAAMRPKDAEKCPPLQNPVKLFDLDAPNMEVYKALPDWIQEKLQKNLNFNGSKLQKLLGAAPVIAEAAPAPQEVLPEETADKPWD